MEIAPMPSRVSNPRKVYLFATCVIDAIYPRVGLAAIQLLRRAGVTVVFPRKQTCCGQPAFNAGFPDEARKVARLQLRSFHRDYPIVVPSGSCAGMMKHHYPELFSGDPNQVNARRFAARVFELGEFLTDILHVDLIDKGDPLKVTWHASCHAMREMGVMTQSKALLDQLKHVELTELRREYECCGFGGTFSIKHPLISEAMVRDKIDDIVQTGARRVISGDSGCLLHIRGAMDQYGLGIQTQHLAEFLWERTHG
jgi:L-lactate dehydrogenase complex protein LldE